MKIIFLDLDKTLINADYKLTVPENQFRLVVKKLLRKNICVGLCSDSAIITLREWSCHLGLTGPIIAERGAVIWDPVQQTENILNISGTAWFRSLREFFINTIIQNFPGATLIIGDATKFIKDKYLNPALTNEVFVINGFRVASFSFFACRPNEDWSALEPHPELLKRASMIVKKIIIAQNKKKEDLFWDENSKYGILIVHEKTTEKWRGVSVVLNRFV